MFTPKRLTALQGVIISLLSVPLAANAADLMVTTAQSATANSSTTGTDEVVVSADLSGTVSDSSGNSLAGVVIKVGEKTATSDNNGQYKITGLDFGTYNVKASKTGYSFDEVQITLSATNPNPILDIKSVDRGNLANVALGTHNCKDSSNQILLLNSNGTEVRNIDSTIKGQGIDVTTTDWDLNKTIDFLIASELFKGNDALVFDVMGKKVAALPVSNLDKGLKVVFGKFADGATAIVVNQANDSKLYFYPSKGSAFSLDILKNAADINVVAADLNNDGIDELIILSSKQINGTNALILDSKGKSLASLLLTLDGKEATTNLPGLVGTVFLEQDQPILAVANAEGSNHQVALYSVSNDFKTTFVRSFGFLGSGTGTNTGTDLCALKGAGGLLLSHFTQNNAPTLVLAENGGIAAVSVDTKGQLIKEMPLTNNDSVISSVAGTNIDLNLPTVTTLPPPGVAIKDVAVVGTPEQPLEVEDREVDGNVHFENVVIGIITIKTTAKITFGQNVRFKHKNHIPKGVNLSGIFKKVTPSYKKVKRVHPAINLNFNIVINAPTILQQVQTKLPTVQQDQTTGNLVVEQDNKRFHLKPTEVKQGDGSKPQGFNVELSGKVTFVTDEGSEVGLVPAMEDMDSLGGALEQQGIGGLEAADSGQMTASPTSNPDAGSYSGVPEMFSEPAADAEPEGLQPADAPNLTAGNKLLRVLVFKDKHGKKRRQRIFPYFGMINFGGIYSIDLTGTVSFSFNGKVYRGMLDYGITPSFTNNGVFDIQPATDGNVTVIYPVGRKQKLYILQ
ncbi:MAG: hypothetical protein RIT27_1081 [Pseudomonadota bacterium]|jgi:hypothetical protein